MSEPIQLQDHTAQPTLPVATRTHIPGKLPVIRLSSTVILPYTVISIPMTDEFVAAADAAKHTERHVLVAIRDPEDDDDRDDNESLVHVATYCKIEQVGRLPNGNSGIILRGIARALLEDIEMVDDVVWSTHVPVEEPIVEGPALDTLKLEVHAAIDAVLDLRGDIPQEIRNFVRNIEDPRQLADNTGYAPEYTLEERITLLTTIDVAERLTFVREFYRKQMNLLEVQQRIRAEVEEGTAKQQREFYLRQQLRAIQKELGEDAESLDDIEELRNRLRDLPLPEGARKEVERELSRLQRIGNGSPEHQVIRTYLEWMADLPWGIHSGGTVDIPETRRILDADHYGLTKVKERILEYLAVRRRRSLMPVEAGERSREPILALVGPPGVGKTSLGQSIAKALGRSFVRMSLGGVRDEAELRGFRRTYIGSAPGRIIQELRRAGSADPVILLDEIDKLGSDHRGDPASALLEILDPEQNNTFTDHYLNVPFDLSNVFFIATANTIDTIPAPLRDRLEIIELSSYVEDEKVNIATQHLVPKQMRANALQHDDVTVETSAVQALIQRYTRESGVRGLERQIGSALRKVARTLEETPDTKRPIVVDADWLRGALGQPRFYPEDREAIHQSGISTGLVWTAVGGDIIYVEAVVMPGAKEFRLTGQMGDVMRESAEAALTCIRSRSDALGIEKNFFDARALHIHLPAGSVPKDGPSAGITMASALASAATGRVVRDDVAMTGEITLRGRVLPVGGIREKVLGAYRAGITTIVLPRCNLIDIEEVPADVRSALTVIPVDTIDDVLQTVLLPLPVDAPPAPRFNVA